MKKIVYPVIIGAFVFISNSAQTQNSYNLLDKDGIKITGEVVECEYNRGRDEKQVVLNIVNTSDEFIDVHYHMNLFYEGECSTCDDPYGEYSRDFSLAPGQTLTGGCSSDHLELNIFYGWVKSSEALLTNIELNNVSIKPNSPSNAPSLGSVPAHIKEDQEAYAKWKKEWVESHPEEYDNLNTSSEKIRISRVEFERMPTARQEQITKNSDKYIIVD